MNKEKTWQEFFDEHADYTVASGFYENRRHFSLEELYQAFKERAAYEAAEAQYSPRMPGVTQT
jgi:hypothetical protein